MLPGLDARRPRAALRFEAGEAAGPTDPLPVPVGTGHYRVSESDLAATERTLGGAVTNAAAHRAEGEDLAGDAHLRVLTRSRTGKAQ
jgi:hypothetical protein